MDAPVGELWIERVRLYFYDSYASTTMTKFPEERVYEHPLWAAPPRVVIEIGVQFGGSALWFRDRLRTLEHYGRTREPLVIGVDIDVAGATGNLSEADPEWERSITLIESDVRDAAGTAHRRRGAGRGFVPRRRGWHSRVRHDPGRARGVCSIRRAGRVLRRRGRVR